MLKDENIGSETFTSIRKKLKEENAELENSFHSKDIMHYFFHSSYGSKEPKIENMKLIGKENKIFSDDCEMHRGF